MATDFEIKLIEVLENIHTELVVANCLTKQDKINQRETFKLQEQVNRLDRHWEMMDEDIRKWCMENLEDGESMDDAQLKERIPDIIKRKEKLEKQLKSTENLLHEYHSEGYQLKKD